MIYTITTDAAYSNEIKRGAYAFMIRSDHGIIQNSGVIVDLLECNSEAELHAIRIASKVLQDMCRLTTGDRIIINTDSYAAIDTVRQANTKEGSKRLKQYGIDIHKMLAKTKGVRYDMRHVKAHTNTQDKRSIANRWCDMEARRMLGTILNK